MMNRQETIFALFATLVALIWCSWDLVSEMWRRCDTREKLAIAAASAVLFMAAMWRGVVPVVWEYGNLLLN